MRLIGKVSHYEKIMAYLTNPEGESEDLTETEKSMLERWLQAFTLQRNYTSVSSAAESLQKLFPDISRATAYRDCAASLSLFGDINKSTKEGIRHLATEIIKDAITLAKSALDYDGMMKGATAMAKVNGVNLIDPDMPDFEKLAPHTYTINLPANALDALMTMVKGGRVDLTSVVDKMRNAAQEVEFTEEKDAGL